MIDVFGVECFEREAHAEERLMVDCCQRAPPIVVGIQVAPFHAQDGDLQFVETCVEVGDVADVALAPALYTFGPAAPGNSSPSRCGVVRMNFRMVP